MDVDFESMSIIRLYRVSDLLAQHRQQIEAALFTNISDLFSLTMTVTLYDQPFQDVVYDYFLPASSRAVET